MAASSMDTSSDNDDAEAAFLDSVEGEIAFFRSVMRTRPVGIHRHFHVLAIRNSIHRDTGYWVSADDIWGKLRDCYDLDVLEGLEIDGYDTPSNNSNTKGSASPSLIIRSPSPSENLSLHPYFREEYTLPQDETIDAIVSSRRMRATASIPSSSPAPSPPVRATRGRKGGTTRGKGRGAAAAAGAGTRKTGNSMAGLVGGDSDSSALTQESGDDGEGGGGGDGSTRMGSVATGTDVGTEDGGGEEGMDESSNEPMKGRKKVGKKGVGVGAGRTRRSSVSKPPAKKRKR